MNFINKLDKLGDSIIPGIHHMSPIFGRIEWKFLPSFDNEDTGIADITCPNVKVTDFEATFKTLWILLTLCESGTKIHYLTTRQYEMSLLCLLPARFCPANTATILGSEYFWFVRTHNATFLLDLKYINLYLIENASNNHWSLEILLKYRSRQSILKGNLSACCNIQTELSRFFGSINANFMLWSFFAIYLKKEFSYCMSKYLFEVSNC